MVQLFEGDGSDPWGYGTTVNRQSNDTRYPLFYIYISPPPPPPPADSLDIHILQPDPREKFRLRFLVFFWGGGFVCGERVVAQ